MHYVPDYLSQVHVRLSSRTPEVDFCGKRTEKKKKNRTWDWNIGSWFPNFPIRITKLRRDCN